MTLKTDKRLMSEHEYIVGMLHQIDAKLDEILSNTPRQVKRVPRHISYGKKHGHAVLLDTQVPGRR